MNASRLFFVCAALALFCASSLVCLLRGDSFAPDGPRRRMVEAARSLWSSGSLEAPEFHGIVDRARQFSRDHPGQIVWQDAVALGPGGRLYPKHSIISVLLAAPFWGLGGMFGIWLFNLLMLLLLLWSGYGVARILNRRAAALPVLVLSGVLTQTVFYGYTLGSDLHGAALIIAGVWLMHSRPLGGAAILCLSVLVRPSHVLLVPPLLLCWARSPSARFRLGSVLAGCGMAAAGTALLNYLLWGGPLLFSYHRVPSFLDGELKMLPHAAGFDWQTFVSDWPQKLFGSEQGVLLYNPALLFVLAALPVLRRHRERFFLALTLAAAGFYSLYIFSYEGWRFSQLGNRFLLPAVHLALFSVYALLERLPLRRGGPAA